MAEKPSRDDQKLLRVAQTVVDLLQPAVRGMDVKVQKPRPPWKTASDGWMTIIGDLGKGKPLIEIWLDGFSRHEYRRFYAGFHSSHETLIEWLAYASKSAVPRRRLADAELADSAVWKLKKRLTEVDLDVPLLETYRDQNEYFFGLYGGQSSSDEQKFAKDAAAFFLEVVRAIGTQKQDDDLPFAPYHDFKDVTQIAGEKVSISEPTAPKKQNQKRAGRKPIEFKGTDKIISNLLDSGRFKNKPAELAREAGAYTKDDEPDVARVNRIRNTKNSRKRDRKKSNCDQ